MSDLFMNAHRCRSPCHSHQDALVTSASPTAAAITSESSSSTHLATDHMFSHHGDSSTFYCEDEAPNSNYNFNNQIGGDSNKKNENNAEEDDTFANILSLKLRKPKHWKWELTTSKSCSNIALPHILLYNHEGQLLVDAQGDKERVFRQKDQEKSKVDKSVKRSRDLKHEQVKNRQRSASINRSHFVHKTLETDLNNLHIQETMSSPKGSLSSHYSRKDIDFNINDLPHNNLYSRSPSWRGVRFNVMKINDLYNEFHVPEFLPTPSTTTTPTSSSSGPRERRKYRRSQSSGRSSAHSESILERFSYQKGRFSSPEYPEENEVLPDCRYFLQTCKAGTLVVKEDSFVHHPRRRRRPLKNRSTESLQSTSSRPLQKQSPSYNSRTPTNLSFKRKHQGNSNVLTNESEVMLPTSDENASDHASLITNNVSTASLCKHQQARSPSKGLRYSPDTHNNGKVR